MVLSRVEVLQALKGQRIRIPSILPLFEHWPQARNQHYESLVPLVDRRLEEVVLDRQKLSKLKQCDFSLFACPGWPWLELDKLYVMACFAIWLFLWDDEIDESTGALESDLAGARQYRSITLAFVEQSIGLCDHGLAADGLHPYIGSFATIGDAVRHQYDRSQKQVFMDEVAAFVHATEAEQKIKQADQLWDVDTYWHYRTSTSAVGIFSALVEFTLGEKLSERSRQAKAVKQVWHETNMIISISNDLFSLKKEIPKGGLDSAVPIACASGLDVQTAIEEAVDDLRARIARIDTDMDDILDNIGIDYMHVRNPIDDRCYTSEVMRMEPFTPAITKTPELRMLHNFTQCHQLICTGITVWSLSTTRYGLQACEQDANGAIHVTL